MLWIIATVTAFFIKGLCGFANTLVFTSILSFNVSNINITPVELILGMPTNLIMTYRYRKNLKLKIYGPIICLVLIGSIPGILLLKTIEVKIVKIIFGVVVIIIAVELLLRELHLLEKKHSKIFLFIVGILSGVLCGLFGVGALLAAYLGQATKTVKEFKANISMVFIIENIFRIVIYTILKIINATAILKAMELIPFAIIGLYCGIKISNIINEEIVKLIVIMLLILSGAVLIINNLA